MLNNVIAQASVSTWLTMQNLSFSTNARDVSSRMWRYVMKSGDSDLTFILTVGGTLFSAAIPIAVLDGGDWRDDVRSLLDRLDYPFVRYSAHVGEDGVVQNGAFWLKTELPIDGDAPGSIPIPGGSLFQAITVVRMTADELIRAHGQRFVSRAPAWVPIHALDVATQPIAKPPSPSGA